MDGTPALHQWDLVNEVLRVSTQGDPLRSCNLVHGDLSHTTCENTQKKRSNEINTSYVGREDFGRHRLCTCEWRLSGLKGQTARLVLRGTVVVVVHDPAAEVVEVFVSGTTAWRARMDRPFR